MLIKHKGKNRFRRTYAHGTSKRPPKHQVARRYAGVPRFPLGLPEVFKTKLHYTDMSNSVAAVATYTYYRWNLTNLRDVDQSGTGTQPPLLDDYRLLYRKWRVDAVTVICDVENYTTKPQSACLVAMYDPLSNNPGTLADPLTYDLEALPKKQRSNIKRMGQFNSSKNVIQLKKRFVIADLIPNYYQKSQELYCGVDDTAPANYAIMDFIIQIASGAADDVGVWASFRFEYDVTFFDRNNGSICAYD